ncbi:MAG: LacI family DNA-binding transcriptional regulator [Tenericutes bacterium]|nr:LacI family DNA-binding transcriptional regulator [Mycoplasmatota bacterium]
MKRIGMSEIAEKLGISKVSVSKALSDKEGVSEELRVRVKEVAENMGYRMNIAARSLKTDRQYNIGILIAEKYVLDQEAYYFSVCGEIIKKLDTIGTSGIMEIIKEETEEAGIMPRVYNEKKVDGIIVLGQLSIPYLRLLENISIPLIYFDFYLNKSDVNSIQADNFYSGYRLTEYLIENGHREIAFVGSINATTSIQDRYLGYYKALITKEIELDKSIIIEDRNEHGILIDIEVPKVLPSAFVCNCDRVAFTLMEKLKSMGVEIPRDCSVVGFDNSLFSNISNPKITTVDHNIEKMVSTAVKVINKMIDNPKKVYDRILIPGTIIYKDSVEKIN